MCAALLCLLDKTDINALSESSEENNCQDFVIYPSVKNNSDKILEYQDHFIVSNIIRSIPVFIYTILY